MKASAFLQGIEKGPRVGKLQWKENKGWWLGVEACQYSPKALFDLMHMHLVNIRLSLDVITVSNSHSKFMPVSVNLHNHDFIFICLIQCIKPSQDFNPLLLLLFFGYGLPDRDTSTIRQTLQGFNKVV